VLGQWYCSACQWTFQSLPYKEILLTSCHMHIYLQSVGNHQSKLYLYTTRNWDVILNRNLCNLQLKCIFNSLKYCSCIALWTGVYKSPPWTVRNSTHPQFYVGQLYCKHNISLILFSHNGLLIPRDMPYNMTSSIPKKKYELLTILPLPNKT